MRVSNDLQLGFKACSESPEVALYRLSKYDLALAHLELVTKPLEDPSAQGLQRPSGVLDFGARGSGCRG